MSIYIWIIFYSIRGNLYSSDAYLSQCVILRCTLHYALKDAEWNHKWKNPLTVIRLTYSSPYRDPEAFTAGLWILMETCWKQHMLCFGFWSAGGHTGLLNQNWLPFWSVLLVKMTITTLLLTLMYFMSFLRFHQILYIIL